MKKTIAILLAMLLLLGTLAGCASDKDRDKDDTEDTKVEQNDDNGDDDEEEEQTPYLPEGMLGTDAVKLLLADERLNAKLLKDNQNIFAAGSEAFDRLAATAEENLVKYTYLSANGFAEYLPLAESTSTREDGSVLEIDGETYRWSNFAEYSNSYDYFENITGNVLSSAKMGGKLIDNIKKNVRVVDKWVKSGRTEYYLHVEENREVLFSRNSDELQLCTRYKNDAGVNVYELYWSSELSEGRMIYIPGQMYVYSNIFENGSNHDFVAENTKGFWEIVDIGKGETHYNVSCMVVKDDICYDAFYDPASPGQTIEEKITLLKVISADKKTDILHVQTSNSSDIANINLLLQGFDGVAHIEIQAPADTVATHDAVNEQTYLYKFEERKGDVYVTTGRKSASVVLENGMVLNEGDILLDGKVTVGRTLVQYFNKENGDGYMPELSISIKGNTFEEKMATLDAFLALTGLECRRNMTYVEAGILQAYRELEQFTQYHEWNESPIATMESLDRGYENSLEKLAAYKEMFDEIKDAQVIDREDSEKMEFYASFPPVTSTNAESVTLEGLTVSVKEFSLGVEDTLLLVEDEAYSVGFALVGTGAQSASGLVHIPVHTYITNNYKGEKSFSVSQSITFTLPTTLKAGTYTLVAYLIAAKEEIRSSEYVPVAFSELAESVATYGGNRISVKRDEKDTLLLSCEENRDVTVSVSEVDLTYTQLYDLLAKKAYTYGFVAEDAALERRAEDGTWQAIANEDSPLPGGSYRLKYNVKNGDYLAEGYILTDYLISETEA